MIDVTARAAPSRLDRADRLVLALCALYAALTFAGYAAWKAALAERSADEAIFENCLWNAAHGNGLRSWIEGGVHHLAIHFSPILLPFVPVYRWIPSMHPLHLAVSLGIAAAGWLLFRMARERLDARSAGLVAGAFVLHPTIVLQTFMDFHEQALAPLPLVWLVHAFRRGALVRLVLAAVLLLSLREDNALFVLGLALVAAALRRYRAALALGALAVAWIALARGAADALASGALPAVFASTYGLWGATPAEALRAWITRPDEVARHLLSPRPLRYVVQLLAPLLGVVGFGDFVVLAAVPSLLLILLADPASRLYEVRLHFTVLPVTVLYVGAIGTLAWLRGRIGQRVARLVAIVLFGIALAMVPIWVVRAIGRLRPDVARVRAVIAVVPDTSAVTAPGYMLNAMAGRRRIALTWTGPATTEYVILEEANPRVDPLERAYTPATGAELRRAGYREIHVARPWHVWRRRP